MHSGTDQSSSDVPSSSPSKNVPSICASVTSPPRRFSTAVHPLNTGAQLGSYNEHNSPTIYYACMQVLADLPNSLLYPMFSSEVAIPPLQHNHPTLELNKVATAQQ